MSTFNYFAYGSNLCTERIHINNPSAVRVSSGILNNYRLDFMTYSNAWKGASATIVPHTGEQVWGAIWQLDSSQISNLDKQEAVGKGLYFPFEIDVQTLNGTLYKCRTYQQSATPESCVDLSELPVERRPSDTYKNCILKGALQSKLPQQYVDRLETIACVEVGSNEFPTDNEVL